MAEGQKAKITGNESELNHLFKETLDGLRDDLNEADENVQLYFDAVQNDPGGKELYGTLYNDALKIKGSARDRSLKFLNMFKDRVSKKEQIALMNKEKTGSEFSIDQSQLNDIVDKIKGKKAEETVKPFIPPPPIDEDDDEEELTNDESESDFEEFEEED